MRGRTRGFTLIELLIVISIISVLTSVVMVSVQNARQVSRNAQRNSLVAQYSSALESQYDAGNSFPAATNYTCLGSYGGTCWQNNYYAESTTLNNAVKTYMVNGLPVPPSITPYNGILYLNCADPAGGGWHSQCALYPQGSTAYGYHLEWFLEGTSRNCGIGYIYDPNYIGLGQTMCVFMRQ